MDINEGQTKSETKCSGRIKSLSEKIPFFFCALFSVYLGFSFLLNIVIDKSINKYYEPNLVSIPNVYLLIPVIVIFALCVYLTVLCSKEKAIVKQNKFHLSDKQFILLIGFIFLCVYIVELFVTYHIYFKTAWDTGMVVENAYDIVFKGADTVNVNYFSRNQNNLLLVYFLALLFKIGSWIVPSNPYAVILAATNAFVCLSVFLSTLCIFKITKKRTPTCIGMVMGILLIAFSPWITIPYSDSFGSLFTVLAVFILISVKNKYLKFFLTTFLCVLGYFLKPTILIVLIAAVILQFFIEIPDLRFNKKSLKNVSLFAFAIILAGILAFSVNKAVSFIDKTEFNESREMTMTHYFMMGLCEKSEGVYNYDDVKISQSFPDVESRQKGNLQEAKERLKDFGVLGYAKHLVKKNINNYNDGSFGWMREGNFFFEIYEDNSPIAGFLRSFYYNGGSRVQFFMVSQQILWLTVLLGAIFNIFKSKTNQYAVNLTALSLLGVSIFLLLFECRARYLFLFSPLFVILFSTGVDNAAQRLNEFIKKRKNK